MRVTNNKPPHVTYAPGPDGRWEKPETDAYLTLVTKFYEKGEIKTSTWYFRATDIHGFEFDHGFLQVMKLDVNGRHQHSYYPASEIIRVDWNEASAAYREAFDCWTMQQFGCSAKDYFEQQRKSNVIAREEGMRKAFAEGLGVSPDDIEFFNLNSEDDDDDRN